MIDKRGEYPPQCETVPSISVNNPDWQLECERLRTTEFRITDVRTVEQVKFVAAFAAAYQLTLDAVGRAFTLAPRPQAI